MDKRRKKTIDDTVCHVHRSAGYAVLSNCFICSTNLGCSAIGLLGKVIDLPPTWNFTKAGLISICPDGETAVETALAELEEWGYLKRTMQMPNESPTGRIRYVYDFYEYSEKDDSLPKFDVVMETYTAENATMNRVRKDSNFTMISGKLLRNEQLKLKHLGFLLKVLSLPDTWHFSMSGLAAICKEGKTAVRSAVNKLIELGYLVRTKLLSSETLNHTFEYVYDFFEKPLTVEEAQEHEAETRRKAISIRKDSLTKCVEKVETSAVSSSFTPEKQEAENLYMDNPPAENLLSENQGQSNTKEKINKNQLLSDKSSIIPSAPKSRIFSKTAVENSADRLNDGYNAEEIEAYTEIIKEQVDYWELGEWLCSDDRDGYAEADEIVGFIVDEICSAQPYTTIRGKSFPRSVIKSQMLKVDIYILQSVLEKMAKVDGIKDFRKYFISSLYNETLTYHFSQGCESRWVVEAVKRDFGYGRVYA